jgi:hypothetical protein
VTADPAPTGVPATGATTGPDGVSVAQLRDEASELTGLGDWGSPTFFPTLELLLESCRATAALTPAGWALVRKVALRHLRNQLYLQSHLSSGGGAGPAVTAPVVITGLPRTGTTLLHNVLALDPGNRVLRFWEGLHPIPVDEDATRGALVDQAQRWLDRLYALTPEFRRIHFSTADGPEECDALLQNAFASQHFDDMFHAADYSAWLNGAELTAEYGYFAQQLQALSRGAGPPPRWVLKSPGHLGYLDTVLRTFPGALIVHCHRDPLEAVASYASLVQAVRAPHTERLSMEVIGRHVLARSANAVDRAMTVREQRDGQFFDVGYRSLVEDPMSVVRRLYDRMGRCLDAEAEATMAVWLQENPQHKHGRHHYELARYGLTAEAIERRLGAYRRSFAALMT